MNLDWVGWTATAVFLYSYRCTNQRQLRRVQALAAGLWVIYGAMVSAIPLVVANVLVVIVALYSSLPSPKPD
jgi:hypothetical protein